MQLKYFLCAAALATFNMGVIGAPTAMNGPPVPATALQQPNINDFAVMGPALEGVTNKAAAAPANGGVQTRDHISSFQSEPNPNISVKPVSVLGSAEKQPDVLVKPIYALGGTKLLVAKDVNANVNDFVKPISSSSNNPSEQPDILVKPIYALGGIKELVAKDIKPDAAENSSKLKARSTWSPSCGTKPGLFSAMAANCQYYCTCSRTGSSGLSCPGGSRTAPTNDCIVLGACSCPQNPDEDDSDPCLNNHFVGHHNIGGC